MRHALTVARVNQLHAARKVGAIADGGNLYLLAGVSWQVRYKWQGARKTLVLGRYPAVSLAQARLLRDAAAASVAAGKDPRGAGNDGDSFDSVAQRWLRTQTSTQKTIERHARAIEAARPAFGTKPMAAVSVRDVRQFFDAIHASGQHGKLKKVRDTFAGVYRFALLHELTSIDPIALLRGAYKLKATRHRPHIEGSRAIRELVSRLREYGSRAGAGTALQLQLLTMTRPGEACGARWAELELDGDSPTWRIPAERMKESRPHTVPLSRQAVELLRTHEPLSRGLVHVFPGMRRRTSCITTAASEGALRAMGYAPSELVPHGLRATASTHLNALSRNRDDIELCLAHAEENQVRAAYNHASRLPERRELLQFWADELDRLST